MAQRPGTATQEEQATAYTPRGPGDAGWQAHKSSTTRDQILDAAIRCIVEVGYAATTTTRIAEKAGISRGAMLHHFPSRMDVIRAAVDYLHEKRLRALGHLLSSV